MSTVLLLTDIAIVIAATVLVMVVIGAYARRILGVRIGTTRIIVAGILALGAEVGFESQFVWSSSTYTPALIPVQLGIIALVSVAFLVIAELAVPQGTVPRPDQWIPMARRSAARTRRYGQLARIATRSRLLPFKVNTEPTSVGSAERMRQAIALTEALEEAGGAFVKLGQLLSTRTDVLPPEFTQALSTLQQRVPPAPWSEVSDLMVRALGKPLTDVFDCIDEEPIAAASIGQVHLATLTSGERVAVKVQRPGIVPLVERDIDIAMRIAGRLTQSAEWARRFGMQELAESLTGSLRDELDFNVEASNIAAMAAVQRAQPQNRRVRIPRCFGELSSREVLVMEHIEGTTLSEPDAAAGLSDTRRHGLATRLFASTLTQIMDAGVFHADLHPGNVMVTADGDIALLDFGSVGRLDSETRRQITNVLLAFSRGDSRSFADSLIDFVDLPDDLDEFTLRRQIGDFMSRYLGPGQTLDAAAFTQVITILTGHGLKMPPELSVAFRAIATVEGSLRLLSPKFDLIAEATEFAQERTDMGRHPSAIAHTIADELFDAVPMLRRLPGRIDRITGDLASGRLNVNLRLLADRRDRDVLREFINLAALSFLAGVFGIMAAMLLTSGGGPQLTPTLSLFQVFGYLLVVVSGVLTLRVLFDVLRRR